MQRSNNPDGAIEVYNGDDHIDVTIENNRIISDSTTQTKTYNCIGCNVVTDTAIIRGNYIEANTPDVSEIILINDSNSGTAFGNVIVEDNHIVANADVDNVVYAGGGSRVACINNELKTSGVTFGNEPYRFLGVGDVTIRDDRCNGSSGRLIYYEGAGMESLKIIDCDFTGMTNRMVVFSSGDSTHTTVRGTTYIVSASNFCFRVADGYEYLTLADNYFETGGTTAITNTGNASVTSELIHDNHTNTA
jgi:hypothetical protein